MKKLIKLSLVSIILLIFTNCYPIQQSLIFYPEKIPKDYKYKINSNFIEYKIEMPDKVKLNAILLKAKNPKGLIFYLHGNAGSLKDWAIIGKQFVDFNYDTFIIDYRGFGKSEGVIKNEQQLFSDMQTAYDFIKKTYPENKIVILGYSIGSGLAAKLASNNNPKKIILEAPYYDFGLLAKNLIPYLPNKALDIFSNFKIETYKYLEKYNKPIYIFHGTADKIINYEHSLLLKKAFPNKIRLTTIDNKGHTLYFENDKKYLKKLQEILK